MTRESSETEDNFSSIVALYMNTEYDYFIVLKKKNYPDSKIGDIVYNKLRIIYSYKP